jgi:hypothetical protein
MSLFGFLRTLFPASDRPANSAAGLPTFLQALSPASYRRASDIENGVNRLFGTHWGCGAVFSRQEAVTDAGRFAIGLAKLSAPEDLSQGEAFQRNQTIFDSRLYDSLGPEDYPFFGRKDAAEGDLLVEEIAIDGMVRGRLFQLLQGRIEIPHYGNPGRREDLLKRLRENCRLLEPTNPAFLSIYLYPDGFCIHAAIRTPWMDAGHKIDGWFNVTTRGAQAGAGAQGIRPGLALRFEPDLPGNADHLAAWTKAAGDLRRALAEAGAGSTQWFSLSDAGGVAPQDFFWPGKYKVSDGEDRGYFFTRDQNDTSLFVSRAARARLAPGRTGQQRLSAMEIACEEIAIEEITGGFRVTGGKPVGRPEVEYGFQVAGGVPEEQLRFGSGTVTSRQLDLAVPLIETARSIRALSGMPERNGLTGEDFVGPLWTFTPIDDGFLHWPLPDATLEGIQSLLEAEKLEDPLPVVEDKGASVVTGGMLLANDASLAGFAGDHRSWQLAVTGGVNGWFQAEIHRTASGTWTLAKAGAKLEHCRIVTSGLVPLVPFRQTPERLLPNQDERALGPASLEAVSPSLLRGLEERMWNRAENPRSKRKVQLKLRIKNLIIAAPKANGGAVEMGGEVELHSTINSLDHGAVDPSLRPWLWRRFDHGLAATQTHALALAGESRRDFSNSRELYPLALAAADASMSYRFVGALDMARPAPGLATDDWTLASPLAGAGRTWVDEPGLAVLTMPSLTVFPGGARSDPARLWVASGNDGKWKLVTSGNPTGGHSFQVELRHDLAWRDEYYATTALQVPAKEKDAAAMDWTGLFTPLDNNGPEVRGGGSSSASAWAQMDRKLALAATDGRELARASSGGVVALANFHGGEELVEDGELDFRVTLDAERLAMAGSIDFESVVLEGLPRTTDLSGFSGTLNRRSYSFGTESGERAGRDDEFADQRGLATRIAASTGNLVSATAGGETLCSLRKPTTAAAVKDGCDLEFWFADLWLGKASEQEEQEEREKQVADGDHLAGYRWAVSCGEQIVGRNLIPVAGQVYFEPRVLKRFEGTGQGAAAWSLRIGGCFVLVHQDEIHVQRLTASDEDLLHDLVITGNEAQVWQWTIEGANKVILPLEQFGADGGPPALIELTWMSAGQVFAKDAKLHFDLFGRAAIAGLKAPDQTKLLFSLANPTSGRGIRLTHASVDLSGGDPTPKLTWRASLSSETSADNVGVTVFTDITHRRYRRDLPASRDLTVEIRIGGATASHTVELGKEEDSFLDDGRFALQWSNPSAKIDEDPAPRLLGFLTGINSGAVFGLTAGIGATADFDFDDYRLTFEIELKRDLDPDEIKAHDLRLIALAQKGAAPEIVLDGTTTLWNCALPLGEHFAAFHFCGSAVRTINGANRIAAQLIHSIKRDGKTAIFPTAQFVSCGTRAGDGALELVSHAAFVAVGLTSSASNLVVLPGRYSDRRLAGNTSPAVWAMPAPTDEIQRKAARRLDEALGGSGRGQAGWLDLLLTHSDTAAGRADQAARTQAEISDFFSLAQGGGRYFAFRPPLAWPDFKPTSVYVAILEQLALVMDNMLVEVPGAPVGVDAPPAYALYGPDIHHAGIIALASGLSPEMPKPEEAAKLARWERRLLDHHAPWAAAALLERNAAKGKGRLYHIVESTNPDPIAYERLDDIWAVNAAPPGDPHRTAMPDAGLEATFTYLPAGMKGIDLTYMGEETGLDWNDEALLASHALQRTWQAVSLDDGKKKPGRYDASRDFWVGDRQAVAFRPQREWSTEAGENRLTPAWSEETLAAAGGAVLTATQPLSGDIAEVADFSQYYSPASLILRDIAPRPGVWNRRRLGVATRPAAHGADSARSPIHAPELPFHARTPRPPLLGRNDLLRASEFEPADFIASTAPQFILYGRRRLAPQVPQPNNALTREPLAAGAWRGVVAHPAHGIVRPDWDGKIRIELSQLAGPSDTITLFQARVNIDGRTIALEKVEEDGDAWLIYGSALLKAVTGMIRPMRTLIECRFRLEYGEAPERRSIDRRVGFELLLMPGRQHVQQEPRYLRFEDPTYNETLVLPAKLGVGNAAVLLVADRENLRPTDVFTVGLQSPEQIELKVTAFRNVTAADGTVTSKPFELVSGELEPGMFRMIDCAALEAKDPGEAAEFGSPRVGDRLEIAATPAGKESSRLIFDVVDEPLFPANPAGIVLLELDKVNNTMSAPLAAQSPVPLMIDLVDPEDLFSGIARFRAQYGAIRYALPEGASPKGYFIQKLAGDGGTFIPADLDRWKSSPD